MSIPDHYSVLGVLPSADDVVIRAAYRALAQRYHPDKWRGNPKEATEKMAEINTAYAVLSDASARSKYDANRQSESASTPFESVQPDEFEPPFDPLEVEWAIATEVYPDLFLIDKRLRRISWRIASAFRAQLLENKEFEKRFDVANNIETVFYGRYFGENQSVIELAKKLVNAGHKEAARELNRLVRAVGSGADANRLFPLLKRKFGVLLDDLGRLI